MGKYDGLKADELRREAEMRELPTSGTRTELIGRLEESDRTSQSGGGAATVAAPGGRTVISGDGPAEVSVSGGGLSAGRSLLDGDGKLDGGEVRVFSEDVRRLADEMFDRLESEVLRPLADMEANVTDAQAGSVVAESQRLRSLVESVRSGLRRVGSASAQLGRGIPS